MSSASTDRIALWRHEPDRFVRDVFGVEPDAWQVQTLKAIGGPAFNPSRRVGMKACTGPGKSALLAWVGWHRLTCYGKKGQHPKGAALSGEGKDNLKDNLWSEMAKWQKRSELLKHSFKWTKERIFAVDHHETWFVSARSYPKDANPEAIGTALSGLHSEFPFILLDEVGNMPIIVGQRAAQIFTGGVIDALIAAAGNPTSTTGLLYHIFTHEPQLWTALITITADPDDPMRTPRVSVEHARSMIKAYGKDNPWVMATILGLFPPGGFNTMIGPDDVMKAMSRRYRADQYSYHEKRLGIDVARFGDDATIIFPRQGLQAFNPIELRNADTNVIADRVLAAKVKWNSHAEFVDGTGGYGAGVVDKLKLNPLCTPHEINFSSRPTDPRYFNKRAEMWFKMVEWIKAGGSIPNHPRLLKDLTAPQYFFKDNKILLEPKELIKKRTGMSPDFADALALTFAHAEAAADPLNTPELTVIRAATGSGFSYDKDPYGDEAFGS